MTGPSRAEVAALVGHLDHFQRRVLVDALLEATAAHWHRRADTFDAARPRPGDYPGAAGTTVTHVDWTKGWPTRPRAGRDPDVKWMGAREPIPDHELPHRVIDTPTRPPVDRTAADIATACRLRAELSILDQAHADRDTGAVLTEQAWAALERLHRLSNSTHSEVA